MQLLKSLTPALQPLVDAPPRPIDATTKADKGARPAQLSGNGAGSAGKAVPAMAAAKAAAQG